MFVSGLSNLLSELEMSEDLFSFGPTSRLVASRLASLESSHERQKVIYYPANFDQKVVTNCTDFVY